MPPAVVGEVEGAVVVVTGCGAGDTVVLGSVLVEVVAVVMARSATLGSGTLDIMALVLALFPALGLFSSLVLTCASTEGLLKVVVVVVVVVEEGLACRGWW